MRIETKGITYVAFGRFSLNFAFLFVDFKTNKKPKRANKASEIGNDSRCRHIELVPLHSKLMYLNG